MRCKTPRQLGGYTRRQVFLAYAINTIAFDFKRALNAAALANTAAAASAARRGEATAHRCAYLLRDSIQHLLNMRAGEATAHRCGGRPLAAFCRAQRRRVSASGSRPAR